MAKKEGCSGTLHFAEKEVDDEVVVSIPLGEHIWSVNSISYQNPQIENDE